MKNVLVTGGSRGIGAAIVKKFTELGDRVVFVYNNSVDEASILSTEYGAISLKFDLSDICNCVLAVEKAIEILGKIDVLVTSQGIAQIGQICDTTDNDWSKIIDTNLSSVFALSREVSKHMVANHMGRIITIGSVWGNFGASCEVAYSSSKAGVRGLTKALAKELAPSGITVNCVEPGVIDTDMNSILSAEDKIAVLEEIPVGRFGNPREVAELVSFLASSDSSYITGQCIGINGGFAE